MDLIGLLRTLLDPMAEHLPIVLDDEESPEHGHDNTPSVLEGHAMLGDGRMVLFGFYQYAARQTITSEVWVTDGVMRSHQISTIGSAARRSRTWSYDRATDTQDLVRTVVAEFVTWIEAFSQASEPAVEAQRAGA